MTVKRADVAQYVRLSRHSVSNQCSSARSLCTRCSYLEPNPSETNLKLCPGCQIHESWKHSRAPCLACQFASIVYQNPFGKRYTTLLNTWLPAASDSDSNSTNSNSHTLTPPTSTPISSFSCSTDPARLTKMRQLTFEDSFNEIRSRSSPEQCQYVIENITMLQQDFKQKNNDKRDIRSLHSDSNTADETADENLAPRKKAAITKQIFSDASTISQGSGISSNRPPLSSLDMNSRTEETRWAKGSRNQIKKHERTLAMNARKLERQKPK